MYGLVENDTEIKEDISFAKLHNKGCIIYYLVYNSKISVPDAVISAYEIGITDILRICLFFFEVRLSGHSGKWITCLGYQLLMIWT